MDEIQIKIIKLLQTTEFATIAENDIENQLNIDSSILKSNLRKLRSKGYIKCPELTFDGHIIELTNKGSNISV